MCRNRFRRAPGRRRRPGRTAPGCGFRSAGTRRRKPVACTGPWPISPSRATVSDLLAGHRGSRPLLLQLRRSEPGQRSGRQHHRLQVGHRRQLAAQRGQDRGLLEHAEPAAAQRFRGGGATGCRRRSACPTGPCRSAGRGRRAHADARGVHTESTIVPTRPERSCAASVLVKSMSVLVSVRQRLTRGRPSATMPMMSR